MASIPPSDMARLPPPEVLDSLDYEGGLAEDMDVFRGLYPDHDKLLESDPAIKLLETGAYRKMNLRARVNDALRARMLAFATGGDLDHVGFSYGVIRLPTEKDDPFRERIALENKARSTGGPKYWYEAAARRADVRVKSAVAWREDLLPIIHIAILSTDNGGIPSPDILAAVSALVQSDAVRLINDTIVVEAAVMQPTAIAADVWLLPDTASSVLDQMDPALRAAWEQESGIGFDLEPSWLRARLHLAGVKRVEIVSPAGPIIATDGTALALGPITINFRGYDR